MATFDEKQQQVLNEINTLIKTSPASAKTEAQNLAIEPVAPEVVPPVVDYLNSQKIPEVDLAGVLSLGAVNSKTAANVAELSEPIDKSIGVNIPEVGTATEKIATGRYQDIDKVRDINQFTYGLEDQMAAASSGSAENNAYVENLRAGNAGLNVATSSRLNPTDRQDGSEAFFGARYPLLQTTVSPFKVVIPEYNLEAKSQTLDPEKLAYQLATNIGGRPVPTYVGYTNSGIDLSEAWYSSLVKGVRNVPVNLADMFVKAGGLGAANVLQAQTRVESAIASYYAGDSDAEAASRLERGLAAVNRATDLSAEDWAAFTKEYKKIFGSEHTEFATGTNYIVEQIPTVLGQVGMIYAANVLGAAQGLNPAITNALVGATFGASQGGDVFTNIQNVAISPTDRLKRANMAAGASTVLNSLGGWAMFGAKAAAARQFMKESGKNYGKRYALAAGEGVLGMGAESLTEGADQVLFNYFSYNMGDDKRAERMNGYVMALVLGAVGGVLSVPAKVFNESLQIYREQILSGKIDADAPEFIKQLSVGVNAAHNTGLYTREQVLDMVLDMASPEGVENIKERQKGAILGMLDRATPEVASYVRNLGAEESARFMNDLKVIDQTVYKNMPEGIDDQTKVMVSRAMQGIASVVTYYGGDFRMPKIEIRNTEPMAYEPDTNTLYINTEATGEAIDFPMVQDKRISLINPVQRGILHELGHLLDAQLGRGTNFENFMPTYFDAIAKVYGKEKAASVKSKMDASGARDAFARSTEPGDVKEKQKDKITETVNEKNTAEYFAYAIGRLGAKVGKVFGMGGGEVAQHIDAINAMAQMVKIPSIQEALSAYQTALETLVKNNSKTIIDMAKAQGEEGLARKIQDFVAGDDLALTKEEVLALYKVLKTYTNVDAAAIIDKAFDGTKIETFMERAEREYGDSIQKEGMTVGELQKRANQKANKEVRRLQSRDNAVVSEEDLPNFEMSESVVDVSDLLGSQKKQFKSALMKRTDAKPDGVNYEDDVKEVSKIMKDAGKAPRWFTRFFANGDITTGLWALGGKKLVEHFDLIGRMNRVSNAATSSLLDFDAKLKKGMGFKSNVERDKFENQASINSIDVDYAVDPLTDQIMGLKISPLVAMNLYNNAKSTVGRRKVLNTFGGNEQQMNKVLNSLTDEQKKEADLMMDFIKENWKYYKESFEQEGDEIDEEPYWPIADAEHIAFGDRRINSTFGRKDDANGMISLDVDAREVFNSYVQRTAGAKEHLYATIQRMKDLFGYQADLGIDNPTTEVRKLSKQMFENSKKIRGLGLMNLGDESKYNKFMDLIDDFLQKHESSLVGSESLNIVARNLTGGLLQWKPIQFMKNLANASLYWGLVDKGGQLQYWKDTLWAATHPIDAKNYMFEKVPYIRNRLRGQNTDEGLTQQTAGQDSLLMNWAKNTDRLSKDGQRIVSNVVAVTQAARRLGYTPMLGGDVSANVVGGYGLLRQYEAKYGDKAGDKLSEDIVMHQASNNQATRSLLQRQWNRDLKGEFLRFGSEGVQKGKSIGLSFAQAARGERSYGSATKETLATLSSMILFALISAGIIDLFDSDEDNDKQVYEALEREGISAVAGFSIIGNSIISPIMSMFLTGEMASIGTPLSNIVSADLRKITKGDYDDAILDGIASVIPVVGVDNLVSMGSGVYRSATAEDSQNFWAGLYQLMGRSENYAEKRTGLKK